MTWIVGLCGDIAGGKSTAARILGECGCSVIDADRLAHEVLQQGRIIGQVVDAFGPSVLAKDGKNIDRKRLGEYVFGEKETKSLAVLESILHPAVHAMIRSEIDSAIRGRAAQVVLDIPLLLETKWDRSCDDLWCITDSPERCMNRAGERGWSAEDWRQRTERQWPIAVKKRFSTSVVENSGTLEQLCDQIHELFLVEGKGKPLALSKGETSDQYSNRHCFPPDV